MPGFSPLTSTATSEDGRNAGDSNNSHSNLGEAQSGAAQASSAPTSTAEQGETDSDGYGWWRRRGDTEPYYYEGMELGLDSLAQALKEEGPFDGVIGFSQGGSAAGLVASLLEPGRRRAFEDAARYRGGMKVPESFWVRRKGRSIEGKQEGKGKDGRTEASESESREFDSNIPASEQSKSTVTAATEPAAQNQPNSHSTSISPNSNSNPNPKTDINEDDYIYEPIHPPLKFAVSYSGYGTLNPLYAGFFNPRIRTPMLHFIGSLDTVVEERRSLMLVDACEDGSIVNDGSSGSPSDPGNPRNNRRVIYHPGGHFLPSSQKQLVEALVGFIKEAMAEALEHKGEEKEEVHDSARERKVGMKSTEVDEEMQHLELHDERNARM